MRLTFLVIFIIFGIAFCLWFSELIPITGTWQLVPVIGVYQLVNGDVFIGGDGCYPRKPYLCFPEHWPVFFFRLLSESWKWFSGIVSRCLPHKHLRSCFAFLSFLCVWSPTGTWFESIRLRMSCYTLFAHAWFHFSARQLAGILSFLLLSFAEFQKFVS